MKNKRWKGFLSLWLAVIMVLSMTAGMTFPSQARTHDIVVLYTNDVHCGVDDHIGYGGLALYKKQMLYKTPYVALADAGDAIQGAPIGTLSQGGYIIDIMNKVGYDFVIPGNHEFDYGMPRFMQLAGKLDCGYNSSNFMDLRTGKPVFAPYKIMAYGSTRIAFVGATTPESFTKSTPKYFQDENGNYIYGFCEDETGKKLYDQIQSSVDAARGEGADLVIVVAHMGENGSTERWTSDSIIKNTNGIDAFIDGHSHETIPSKTVNNKDGKAVLLTQTGTKLANIGKMTISPDKTISTQLISKVEAGAVSGTYTVKKGDTLSRIAKRELGSYSRWKEIFDSNRNLISDPNKLKIGMELKLPGTGTVMGGRAVDYDTQEFINSIEAQYQETLKAVLGHSDVALTVKNPDTGERAVRSAETNLGDLTADAFRKVLGADIGLLNGGGIRGDIKPGNITYNDTLAVFPFGNMGCVAEVRGQQIKDALEMASKNSPKESGGFLQVSGLTYTIDTSAPESVQLDDKGNFIKVAGPYRVTDIMVDGQPLDAGKTYTVASHNYMLKAGGDGMTMFAGSKILRDEVMADVDILSAYISANLKGNVGRDYADPHGQGRITVK